MQSAALLNQAWITARSLPTSSLKTPKHLHVLKWLLSTFEKGSHVSQASFEFSVELRVTLKF